MMTAAEVIERLQLQPLPCEGGYYRETYRSARTIPAGALAKEYPGARSCGTAIYYLLTPDTFSALHRLPGDEIYHFYLGDPVEMLQLHANGAGERIVLGNDLSSGMGPQWMVPGGTWQGSRLLPGGKFALMGTTMAPGFEFEDYVPGRRAELMEKYPEYARLIERLT